MESNLSSSSSNVMRNRQIRLDNRKEIIDRTVMAVPDVIQTLQAYQFYERTDRAFVEPGSLSSTRPPMTYSDCKSPLGTVRAAMLLLLSALPQGCVDDQVRVVWCVVLCCVLCVVCCVSCKI